jgi:hypothetical protein
MPEAGRNNESVFALFKMCISSVAYHRKWLEEKLHSDSPVRCAIFMIEDIPSTDYVTTKHPWDATADTPEFTGLPPDTILLASLEAMKLKQEEMKQMIAELRAEIQPAIARALDAELTKRNVGGAGFSQAQDILEKLGTLQQEMEKLSTAQQSYTNQLAAPPPPVPQLDIDEYEDFDLGEGGGGFVEYEEDIIIEIPNESPQQSAAVQDRNVRRKTAQQMEKRTLTMGHHHGTLNPLPSTWRYPKELNVIQLMTLWLLGNQREKVPPLEMLESRYVNHFDRGGRSLSKMKQLMRKVKEFAEAEDSDVNVWRGPRDWDGETVTTLWSTIWYRLDPYLRTETEIANGDEISYGKSRRGQISWRTCYNKMQLKGLFKGNKVRRKNTA